MRLESGTVVPLEDLRVARQSDEEPIRQILAERNNLEMLAEAEHNGWMVERMLNGWRYGTEERQAQEAPRLLDSLQPAIGMQSRITTA